MDLTLYSHCQVRSSSDLNNYLQRTKSVAYYNIPNGSTLVVQPMPKSRTPHIFRRKRLDRPTAYQDALAAVAHLKQLAATNPVPVSVPAPPLPLPPPPPPPYPPPASAVAAAAAVNREERVTTTTSSAAATSSSAASTSSSVSGPSVTVLHHFVDPLLDDLSEGDSSDGSTRRTNKKRGVQRKGLDKLPPQPQPYRPYSKNSASSQSYHSHRNGDQTRFNDAKRDIPPRTHRVEGTLSLEREGSWRSAFVKEEDDRYRDRRGRDLTRAEGHRSEQRRDWR